MHSGLLNRVSNLASLVSTSNDNKINYFQI